MTQTNLFQWTTALPLHLPLHYLQSTAIASSRNANPGTDRDMKIVLFYSLSYKSGYFWFNGLTTCFTGDRENRLSSPTTNRFLACVFILEGLIDSLASATVYEMTPPWSGSIKVIISWCQFMWHWYSAVSMRDYSAAAPQTIINLIMCSIKLDRRKWIKAASWVRLCLC